MEIFSNSLLLLDFNLIELMIDFNEIGPTFERLKVSQTEQTDEQTYGESIIRLLALLRLLLLMHRLLVYLWRKRVRLLHHSVYNCHCFTPTNQSVNKSKHNQIKGFFQNKRRMKWYKKMKLGYKKKKIEPASDNFSLLSR